MAAPAAFIRKNRAQAVNGWRLLRAQPPIKLVFISVFALACEVGLYALFNGSFVFLERFGGMSGLIMGRLFSLFFLGMGLMLVMSGIITSYACFYRSEEIPYLLTHPLPVSRIILYKFVESTYLSSWAFMFVIIPFVAAYAVNQRFNLAFGVWTFLFAVPFLAICSGIGTLAIMLCVRGWPRAMKGRPLLLVLLAAVLVAVLRTSQAYTGDTGTRFVLSAMVPGMRVAGNMLVPSTWVAEGILACARAEVWRGALLWGMAGSTAAVLWLVIEWVGCATFQQAWERVNEGGGQAGRGAGLFRVGDRLLGCLPRDLRAIIMKDVRTFFRDPMQWSQVLIFFGLLGMYFANLRNFHYDTFSPHWRSMICFLNVFSVSAVLCSLGARFIYPQLSLEGQGFWLLGLSPTSMRRVLLGKYVLAVACTGVVSLVLIGLSSSMLKVGGPLMAVSLGLVLSVVTAISGLSTGLGAVFMDLRQRNPAAIVGGFGGTVNLIISLGFMLAVMLPFGLIFHLKAGGMLDDGFLRRGLLAATVWTILATTAVTVIPLVMGFRALRDRDY